jgi:hypothetical protein
MSRKNTEPTTGAIAASPVLDSFISGATMPTNQLAELLGMDDAVTLARTIKASRFPVER